MRTDGGAPVPAVQLPSMRAKQIDNKNPKWTAKDFARAHPASEVLPEILGADVAAELLRPCGRPRLA